MNARPSTSRVLTLLLPAALALWCLMAGEETCLPRAPRESPAESAPPVTDAESTAMQVTWLRECTPPATTTTPTHTTSSPTPPQPTAVRLVVRLAPGVPDCGLPVPELLRLDASGRASPASAGARTASHRHPALELAIRRAQGEPARTASEASRVFEVSEPGLYVAAWHLWLQVPGTRTWRVLRGRGPELFVSGTGGAHEVVVLLGTGDLRVDPSLDARSALPHYRITPKDG